MDVRLEFDILDKCGVDGINLLIWHHNSSNLWGLFPHYITFNIVSATIEIISVYMVTGTISQVVYIGTKFRNFSLFVSEFLRDGCAA